MEADIKSYIRSVPDFPKPGILFYDISTLLANAEGWRITMDRLKDIVGAWKPDILAGIESRGFLVAAPLALELNCGFFMVRKKGKLPGPTIPYEYGLEYGSDTIEVQTDAVAPGARVVILDDLLATGGTMRAAADLIRQVGGNVIGAATILELSCLKGREKLDFPCASLAVYEE